MSDDPIGVCCAIAIVACLDVCTGICIDFASFRHGFTESMFRCRRCGRSDNQVVEEEGEHAPLIRESQPAPSEAMVPNRR